MRINPEFLRSAKYFESPDPGDVAAALFLAVDLTESTWAEMRCYPSETGGEWCVAGPLHPEHDIPQGQDVFTVRIVQVDPMESPDDLRALAEDLISELALGVICG